MSMVLGASLPVLRALPLEPSALHVAPQSLYLLKSTGDMDTLRFRF